MTPADGIAATLALVLIVGAGWAAGRGSGRSVRRDAERAAAAARAAAASRTGPSGPGAGGQPAPGEGLDLVARPRRGLFLAGLAMVLACYVVGFGGALFIALRAEWIGAGTAAAALAASLVAALAWLLGFAWLSLYVIGEAHRFAFHDRGMSVVTWRGRRWLAWADVRAASTSTRRGSVSLVLTFADRQRVEIPLEAYECAAALRAAIERRLPTATTGPARPDVPADRLRDG